jgi:hypothetical protein
MADAPLKIEEHRELAHELRQTDARLHVLSELVTGVYGAESRVAFMFRRAAESVSRLRQEMQVQAALDLPGDPIEQIYL